MKLIPFNEAEFEIFIGYNKRESYYFGVLNGIGNIGVCWEQLILEDSKYAGRFPTEHKLKDFWVEFAKLNNITKYKFI